MPHIFLWLAFVLAGLNWIACEVPLSWLRNVTKAGVILALLAWLWQNNGLGGPMVWFALGIALSGVGDVLLMLPPRAFTAGLVAFLLAHVAYVIGFNSSVPALSGFNLGISLFFAVGVLAAAIKIGARLKAGLAASGNTAMLGPVLAYAGMISLMLFSALLTFIRVDWSFAAAARVSAGALLFFVSDTLLAWNRFIRPLAHINLTVMTTYHLGQFAILLGAAVNYMPGL